MKNFLVKIHSQTASFRNPNFQTYHKSLTLPPPTTIIGLAGAALGLTPLQAQDFFHQTEFKIGVYGTFEGKCNDLWKFDKRVKNLGLRYNPNLDGSVIMREFLIQNKFLLAFSSNNQERLTKLYKAFKNPIYALTMGNSDSLAFIKLVISDVDVSNKFHLQHCMVKGDVIDNVTRSASKDTEFSIYQSTSEPITYDLPIRFDYKSDYGKRNVSSVSTFSIISKKMKLNYKVEGLSFQDKFIPLFKL